MNKLLQKIRRALQRLEEIEKEEQLCLKVQ